MTVIRKKVGKGIRIKKENIEGGAGAIDLTLDGEIGVDANDNKVKVRLNSSTEAVVTEDQTQTLTNKTHTSAVLNTGVSGSAVDTDDTLAADSDTLIPSQKAVKAYVASQVATETDLFENRRITILIPT